MPNRQPHFARYVVLTIALFVALTISFIVYVASEKAIDRANELRHVSYLLANELRQSSDDLTRMARTYVVTGDPLYKKYYQAILNIRDGKVARPEGYQNAYWDLALANRQAPRPDGGQASALLELMRQAEFSAEEFGKLAEAKASSDGLTSTELAAMQLVESAGPEAEAKRALARQMMHDEKYHQAKAAIMQPINEFFALMEARTSASIHGAESKAMILRVVFIAFVLSLMFALMRTNRFLHATLGGTVDEVHAHITRIGHGDFSTTIPGVEDKDKSVLGCLAKTQRKLKAIDHERKQVENELLRSNRELEQFSYSISHDMRQPLRMISSYMKLLETGLADQLDSDKREYFNFAIDGARRLDAMLLGLLEYSRVGRKGEPPAWIESRAALDEALLYLRPTIAEAGAEVRIEGAWPRIFVSPDEMLRLLQNLIDNALKYRIAGRTPEITVRGEIAGERWRLCVADNGVGILPGQRDRLFQVFQRLHSRADYEGTGIGLALCRKIVEHHGGSIRVESEGEGQGSCFCVELPLGGEGA